MRTELRCSQEIFTYNNAYHSSGSYCATNFFCAKTPWPLLFAKVSLVEATCRWDKLKTCSQTHQMCYNSSSSLRGHYKEFIP